MEEPGTADSRAVRSQGKAASLERADAPSLLAEVSHELRLPIANLKLLVETLIAGAFQDRDAGMRMLARCQEEVERLQNLVLKLLSAEGNVRGLHDPGRCWVALGQRIEYAFDLVRRQAGQRGIELSVQVDPDFKLYANPEQLDQVLINLIENAVKFTGPGGTVTVKAGVKAGIVEVEDTGVGIPESEIPRIFRRFYRVDRSRFPGSTGLGLSIVKHIADLHNAKISVRSKEGSGTTFSLEFPGPDTRQPQ